MRTFVSLITSTSALLLFLTVSALAQTQDKNVSINVSAQVISTIEMITMQSINLADAEAINDRIQINPQTSNYAGKMMASGTPNSEIRISFLQQRELTQVNGSDVLTFNYEIAGNDQEDQASAEILSSENRDFQFNDQGNFYLWIGGSVDISTASPGNYQGEFTLDIEYIE